MAAGKAESPGMGRLQAGWLALLLWCLRCGGGGGGGAQPSPPPPPPPPVATSLTANPPTIAAGGSSQLTPVFSNGTGAISPGNLPATSGQAVTVSPATTTTYTLTVTNSAGATATTSALVTVGPAPPTPSNTPVDVTYRDDDGQTLTVPAFPGEILVLARNGLSAAHLASLAAPFNGRVLTASSDGALFTVIVNPGSEDAFLQAVRSDSGVFHACPDLATYPMGTGVWIIDDFKNAIDPACPGLTHGNAVRSFLGSGTTVDVGAFSGVDRVSRTLGQINAIAKGNPGVDVVINLSQGSYGRSEPANLVAATQWLAQVGTQLLQPDFPLDRTVVVVAAGNGVNGNGLTQGSDLGPWLKSIFDAHPELVGHLVVVGGSGKRADCGQDRLCNFSSLNADRSGNPLMLRAPDRDLPVAGSNCVVTGTSFAAPQQAQGLAATLLARPAGQSLGDAVKDYIKANTSQDPACFPGSYTGEFDITKNHTTRYTVGNDTFTITWTSTFHVRVALALVPNPNPPQPGKKVYAPVEGQCVLKSYQVSGTRTDHASNTGTDDVQPIVPDPSRPVNNDPIASTSLLVDFESQIATWNINVAAWAAYYFAGNPIPYVRWQDAISSGTFTGVVDSGRSIALNPTGTSIPGEPNTISETVTTSGARLTKGP